MHNVYFGSPLFSDMERQYNKGIVEELRNYFGKDITIYLPQENAAINDKSNYANSVMIANGDNAYLENADILVAVLDGPTIDVGLASEIGYFYSKKKPIIGLYTDSRQGSTDNPEKVQALNQTAENQFAYVNLYTVGLIKLRGTIVSTVEDLVSELAWHIYD